MERTVVYHDTPGPDNTEATVDLALAAAMERSLDTLVVASRTGSTAAALMERLANTDLRMVVVTPQYGWLDEHEFDRSLIQRLRERGHEFYAGAMPFHTDSFHGCSAPKRMGDILRIFSEGVQVCVEIGIMAVDGGLLKRDQRCVLIAGTGHGLDTGIIATPASSASLEQFRVHEILCKPLLMANR